MSLVVAPASAKAATYAVTHWHYSRTLPAGGRRVKLGVWEDDQFIGVVILSRGSASHLGQSYGLVQTQVCELTRIALREHKTPVSKIVARCLRRLKSDNPGMRLIFSYADPGQGHHGGIYQAGNWIYTGIAAPGKFFRLHGELVHERALGSQYGRVNRLGKVQRNVEWLRAHVDPHAEAVTVHGKHRYLYPLDRAMRRQITPLAKPYPAAEVSTETRHASGEERQVQPLPAAPVTFT